eukprot:scaffold25511_cov60-Phaeocystis_antarctica.AAC.2
MLNERLSGTAFFPVTRPMRPPQFSEGENARPHGADRACCTLFRHFLKFDSEPPVEVYASLSLISGRSSVSSTARSALMVPPSGRLAPSAVASVCTTCFISTSVRANCIC